MNNDGINEVIKVLKDKDNFLITAHINPEGDSIGSQLAVYYMLKKLGKAAVMFNRDDVPGNLEFLPKSDLIMHKVPEDFKADVVIVLDCPVLVRIGEIHEDFNEKEFIVNIDHHISNEFFGDINWVEPHVSSVGEMIFMLAEKLAIEIEKDLATVLYAAIVTDTGMFNYANTSCQTHRVTGELISGGVNPKQMHNEIFEKKSVSEIKLLGKVLSTLQVESGGALAYMTLTGQMCAEIGPGHAPTNEFINFPRSIKGVEVAVFFKEEGRVQKKINVSFRSSEKVNVDVIAGRFGGGGHARAAGCVLDTSLQEAQDKVLAEVRKALKK